MGNLPSVTDAQQQKNAALLANDDLLGGISSFAEAVRLLEANGNDIVTTDDLGSGFVLLDDQMGGKDVLIDVPFVIVGMKFQPGDYKERFVVLFIVTDDNKKLIVTDGGSGIRAQCENFARVGRTAGIICKRGLLKSEFTYDSETGKALARGEEPSEGAKAIPATTYYLA